MFLVVYLALSNECFWLLFNYYFCKIELHKYLIMQILINAVDRHKVASPHALEGDGEVASDTTVRVHRVNTGVIFFNMNLKRLIVS